ncbi:MAG: hypothetical protein JWO08_3607 [Verrucomicrobiaceae bacterium]|nr:hypothetical protein [Verrucomicrobiaceae bacterium]
MIRNLLVCGLIFGLGICRCVFAVPDNEGALEKEGLNTGHHCYVATNGSDTNAGTQEAPLLTIARASKLALPGTTVHVAPGTYPGGFSTLASGTSAQRIAYISTVRWGARIVPPARSASDTAWDNRGSYVDIVGFDVDGSAYQGGKMWTHGLYYGGSFGSIRNNHVHHIAQTAPCTSAGGSAIGADSYYHGVEIEVIGNLVHDLGPPGCRFIQGIYFSTSGTISNNVVYRVAEAAIHLWHDANHVTISNNTVFASHTGIIVGGGDFYHASAGNDHTEVYNNIVYDNECGISEQGRTGAHNSYRHNLVSENSTCNWRLQNGLTHEGTVNAAPRFVNYSKTAVPDLHLKSSSPAIGKGAKSTAIGVDFEGKRRPPAGVDIGAFQH